MVTAVPTRNVNLTDELKLTVLRKQIRAGAEALDRGDYIDIDDADLDTTLDRLGST